MDPWNISSPNMHEIFGFSSDGSTLPRAPLRRRRIKKTSVCIRANLSRRSRRRRLIRVLIIKIDMFYFSYDYNFYGDDPYLSAIGFWNDELMYSVYLKKLEPSETIFRHPTFSIQYLSALEDFAVGCYSSIPSHLPTFPPSHSPFLTPVLSPRTSVLNPLHIAPCPMRFAPKTLSSPYIPVPEYRLQRCRAD